MRNSNMLSKSVFNCVLITISCGSLWAQVPAPIPPPEPVFLEEGSNSPAAQQLLPSLAAHPDVSPLMQQQKPNGASKPLLDDSDLQTKTLPHLIKSRPLSTMTLRDAAAEESLKHESLAVPQNAAAEYLVSKGVVVAEPTFVSTPVAWSQAVCYRPLYFEDPNLERCGAGHGIATEFVSAVRFFGRVPLLPYLMGSQDPNKCVRSLGDCKVCHTYDATAYLPPLNAKGVAFQAAATVGLVFLLP